MFYNEIGIALFLLFYPFLSDAQQVKHYLHYRFSVLTKANTLPEFSGMFVVDDKQIKHYSNEERVWVLTEDDWTEAPEEPPDSRGWFIYQMKTLSNCTNSQCAELHVLQRIIGCELEKLPEGSVNLRAFDEYGVDGEDFIAFNSDTLQWIDKTPKAKETKMKWDQQRGRNWFLQHFHKTCMNWISTFNNMKKSNPNIHIFERKAPDDHSKLVLSCLATGFYPRDIEMNIRLDRTNLEEQTSSEIRPNADGTFQMRTSLKIDRNHKGSYDCLVNHSSLTEPVSTNWVLDHASTPEISDPALGTTSCQEISVLSGGKWIDSETQSLWPLIVGVIVLACLLTVCLCYVNDPMVIGTAIAASSTTGLLVRNHFDEQNKLLLVCGKMREESYY